MPQDERTHILRVTRGINLGASVNLRDGQAALIGSDPSCDVVLASPGIEPRHCIVTIANGRLQVRAIDGQIHIDGGAVQPESALEVAQAVELDLNDATTLSIELGAADRPSWWAGLAARWRPMLAPVSLALAAVVSVFLISNQVLSARPQEPTPTLPAQQLVAEYVDENGWSELTITPLLGDRMGIAGVIPTHSALHALTGFVDQQAAAADWNVSVGEQIAKDVQTVLKAEGLKATTRYLGAGNVEVRGMFSDESLLARSLNSRAMKDIDGLAKAIVSNQLRPSAPAEPVATADEQPKRIKSLVRGDDPYLIANDNSIYYTNSLVPGLGRFLGIRQQDVLFEIDGQLRKFAITSDLPAKLEYSAKPVDLQHL